MSNIYQNSGFVKDAVSNGRHREVIGGMWDEAGLWQLNFLKSQGLVESDRLLDIGCGSLRGGVHFIKFLNPQRYVGLDMHSDLLEAGYEIELAALDLQSKLDRADLITSDSFDFSSIEPECDFALAQSVFTHVDWNQIRLCLSNLCSVMKSGGRFFATYFEVEEGFAPNGMKVRPHGIISKSYCDPYHYRFGDLERAIEGFPIRVRRLGDVGHPRGQHVAEFTFEGSRSAVKAEHTSTRTLDPDAAGSLPPGADHYRAYVGPPQRFDFMSSTQFALLYSLGLREDDSVLDIGCGSLRLGRLLIPFLREGKYCGIDPNEWLISEGIKRELGEDSIRLKRPEFSYRSDFSANEFGRKFDFIIAQSIATHTGPDMLAQLLRGAASALASSGVFAFSYIRCEDEATIENGWHYPQCIEYSERRMIDRMAAFGLAARPVLWFHPGAVWMLAAHSEEHLPKLDELWKLVGQVVDRPAIKKGYGQL